LRKVQCTDEKMDIRPLAYDMGMCHICFRYDYDY
jgi:hypothetical protein